MPTKELKKRAVKKATPKTAPVEKATVETPKAPIDPRVCGAEFATYDASSKELLKGVVNIGLLEALEGDIVQMFRNYGFLGVNKAGVYLRHAGHSAGKAGVLTISVAVVPEDADYFTKTGLESIAGAAATQAVNVSNQLAGRLMPVAERFAQLQGQVDTVLKRKAEEKGASKKS